MRQVQQRWDKKRGELQRVVSEGNTTDCMGGHVEQQRHAAPAAEARWRGRDSTVGTAPARRAVARRTVGRCRVV
jgi:hypothetical protein